MMDPQKTIASLLLDIKAVKLQPDQPFTWASGWKSPIYCDNRKTLSFPKVRQFIQEEFARLIREKYPQVEVIAGVATGAIAHGVLVAAIMNLPFIYVRSTAKSHGLGNQVEGAWTANQKVVVIEDLVSTGGSSLAAVAALQDTGLEVLGLMAIFSYGFDTAIRNFDEAGVELCTLSNYSKLIELAKDAGYIEKHHETILQDWRENPANWKQ